MCPQQQRESPVLAGLQSGLQRSEPDCDAPPLGSASPRLIDHIACAPHYSHISIESPASRYIWEHHDATDANSQERAEKLGPFLREYHLFRQHEGIGGQPPITRLSRQQRPWELHLASPDQVVVVAPPSSNPLIAGYAAPQVSQVRRSTYTTNFRRSAFMSMREETPRRPAAPRK